MIDTGATCSVMPEQNISKKELIVESKSGGTVKLYDGTVVPATKHIDLYANRGPKWYPIRFKVLDVKTQTTLLGGEDAIRLGVADLHADEVNIIDEQAYQATISPNKKQPVCSTKETLTEQHLIHQYKDVFTGLGKIGEPYHLDMDPEVKPVQSPPRNRYPIAKLKKIETAINTLIEKGIATWQIEPTEWLSNMIAVEKPDGSVRVCIDPVDTLNKALLRRHYPTPTLDEQLYKLAPNEKGRVGCFTQLDAEKGFNQIELTHQSSLLTTTYTPLGRIRWLRTPFGISTAPEEYQRRQSEILHGLDGVLNVADDILVFGRGNSSTEIEKDHDQNLRALMKRLRERGMTLNQKKLKFKQTSVKFLGHIIDKDGLRPDPSKISAIVSMQQPSSATEARIFLGMINYLSRFVPHLSEITKPIRVYIQTGKWETPQEEAFNTAKQLISKAPTLAFWDPNGPATLQVDASKYGLGACLLQGGRPVAYASCALTETESESYVQLEKECLAIVYGCEHFDQYLYGKKFLVESDHMPLETIFKKSIHKAPTRLQKMMLRLQRYDLNVSYKKGENMKIADALSRAPQNISPSPGKENTNLQIFMLDTLNTVQQPLKTKAETTHLLKEYTKRDSILQELSHYIHIGFPDDPIPSLAAFWTFKDELTVSDGIIYKSTAAIVPEELRGYYLKNLHETHQSGEAALERARGVIFWPNMRADIINLSKDCTECLKHNSSFKQKEPMMTHPVPTRPWQYISQDLCYYAGQDYLITVCHYSDWIEVDTLSNKESETIVKHTKQHHGRYGTPDVTYTDGGPEFRGRPYAEFAADYKFKHVTSSPYYSQSNGKAESAVKVFKNMLKKNTDVQKALMYYRNAPTSNMTSSPAQRFLCRTLSTPDLPHTEVHLQQAVVPNVPEQLIRKKQITKKTYDKNVKALPELQVGDHVAFKPAGKGPWREGEIIGSSRPRSYDIIDPNGQQTSRNRRMLTLLNQGSGFVQNAPDIPEPDDEVIEASQPKTFTNSTTQPNTKTTAPVVLPKSPQPVPAKVSASPVVTRSRTSGREIRPVKRLDL